MTNGAFIAMAASQIAAEERCVLDAFRLADATAPDRARTPHELHIAPDAAFGRLVSAGVLRERARGAFYLDESAVIARRSRKPSRVLLIVLVMVLVLVLLGLVALLAWRPD